MNSIQKLKLTSVASILNRIILVLSGFILPRLYLVYFGPEIHGLTQSINQFLNIITFLDLGVGAVIQSALYRPLTENDNNEISKIVKAANSFFRKIAVILIFYVIILIFVFPTVIDQSLDFISTATLIIAMSLSIFAQYYFGITNELLITADQRSYIQLFSEIIIVVLNVIVSMLLIPNGFSIQSVRFMIAIVYLIRPVFLSFYVSKNYRLDKNVSISSDTIPQKWNGFAQHIAYTITTSTDIFVLTLFSTFQSVSIYSVYNMVVQGIRLLINSAAGGFRPFFGNLIAQNKISELNNYFGKIEWLMHNLVIYLFATATVLIVPFVDIYTSGVENLNYDRPLFAIGLIIGQMLLSIRIPYQNVTLAAGHYKQTQVSSFIEAILNIVISLVLVQSFDILGVVIGTLISVLYRTLYLVEYLSKNILNRPKTIFIKYIIFDSLIYITIVFLGMLVNYVPDTIITWIQVAVIFAVLNCLILLIFNLIFFPSYIKHFTSQYLKR